MKSTKTIFIAILAVLFGPLVVAFAPQAPIAQAAPQCFSGSFSSTGSTNVVPYTGNCGDGAGGIIDEASNNCYGITAVGTPVQIDCNPPNATQAAGEISRALCFKITGQVTNPDDPTGAKVPRYASEDCYQWFNSGLTNIEVSNKDKCYVIDTAARSATEEGCLKIYLQSVAVANFDARAKADTTNTASLSHTATSSCTSSQISSCGFFKSFVLPAINFLSAGVVLIVIIMIVVGGIRYSSAGDNPQVAAAAKGHIYNAIIALLLYFFLFALLQWIIPGGIFST